MKKLIQVVRWIGMPLRAAIALIGVCPLLMIFVIMPNSVQVLPEIADWVWTGNE